MTICKLCNGNSGLIVDGMHYLCKERNKRGIPTPRAVDTIQIKAKVIDNQLFEYINGKWVITMRTVIFK